MIIIYKIKVDSYCKNVKIALFNTTKLEWLDRKEVLLVHTFLYASIMVHCKDKWYTMRCQTTRLSWSTNRKIDWAIMIFSRSRWYTCSFRAGIYREVISGTRNNKTSHEIIAARCANRVVHPCASSQRYDKYSRQAARDSI